MPSHPPCGLGNPLICTTSIAKSRSDRSSCHYKSVQAQNISKHIFVVPPKEVFLKKQNQCRILHVSSLSHCSLQLLKKYCWLWNPIIDLQPQKKHSLAAWNNTQGTQKNLAVLAQTPNLPTCGANWRDLTSLAIAWFDSQTGKVFPRFFPNGHRGVGALWGNETTGVNFFKGQKNWNRHILEKCINLQKTPTEKFMEIWIRSDFWERISLDSNPNSWRTSLEKSTSICWGFFQNDSKSKKRHLVYRLGSEHHGPVTLIDQQSFDGSHRSHPPVWHAFRTRSLSLRHSCRGVKPPPKASRTF